MIYIKQLREVFQKKGLCLPIWMLILFLLSGCLDVIDVEVPQSEQERLVVQGKLIIGEPGFVEILLSRLYDFTAAGKRPLTARAVFLLDEEEKTVELEHRGLGYYFAYLPAGSPDFEVSLGIAYRIRVETFDNRIFESSPETGYPVPQAENLSIELVERSWTDQTGLSRTQELIQFNISTPLQTGAGRARVGWQSEWTFKVLDSPFDERIMQKTCYVTQQLGVAGIKVLNSDEVIADYLQDYTIYENEITRNFAEGLVFTAIQESLSEGAYTYFDQIAQNINRSGNMFESPPGAVVTNFHNLNDENDPAFGYFYVTQRDTIRRYIRPEEVGSPPFYCPPPGGILTQNGYCADFICCDCLSVDNSTTEVPDFWEE